MELNCRHENKTKRIEWRTTARNAASPALLRAAPVHGNGLGRVQAGDEGRY
jgi:hypothetical protein